MYICKDNEYIGVFLICIFFPHSQRATLAEKEVTALKEQLTNNKTQDTNVMTMATPLSNHVESTEDQNKTPAELELSAKEKEVSIYFLVIQNAYVPSY